MAIIDNIKNLVLIAQQLNLDGWFINYESYDSTYDSRGVSGQVSLLMKNVFPDYKKMFRGVEFIVYTPRDVWFGPHNWNRFEGDVMDNRIANFGRSVDPDSAGLCLKDWAVKSPGVEKSCSGVAAMYASKDYLMFLDAPFWNNKYSTRMNAAKASACKFFQGAKDGNDVWEGFKYYTQMRYPSRNEVTNLPTNKKDQLCNGDVVSLAKPDPKLVLALSLPLNVYASVKAPGDQNYQSYCGTNSSDVSDQTFRPTCDISSKQGSGKFEIRFNFAAERGFRETGELLAKESLQIRRAVAGSKRKPVKCEAKYDKGAGTKLGGQNIMTTYATCEFVVEKIVGSPRIEDVLPGGCN